MSALTPGTRLGPYEVVADIGAGGMGEVYQARDTRLDRIVAIKVLSSGLASDPQVRERFEREARAISSLKHANICVLHDVGRERPRVARSPGDMSSAAQAASTDAVPIDFLVMEYLEGETLAARLARGATRARSAAHIATAERPAQAPTGIPGGGAQKQPRPTYEKAGDARALTDRPGDSDHRDATLASTTGTSTLPPMAVTEALQIAIQIADALDTAHRQGIVHRDLKPGNVMLTQAGQGAPRVKRTSQTNPDATRSTSVPSRRSIRAAGRCQPRGALSRGGHRTVASCFSPPGECQRPAC